MPNSATHAHTARYISIGVSVSGRAPGFQRRQERLENGKVIGRFCNHLFWSEAPQDVVSMFPIERRHETHKLSTQEVSDDNINEGTPYVKDRSMIVSC
jgi:hypothetical protein